MSIGDHMMGFLLGICLVGMFAGGGWGLMLGLEFLAGSMNGETLCSVMLVLLALPMAYGIGLGIVANRNSGR